MSNSQDHIANIGSAEKRKRFIFGLISLLAGILVLSVMFVFDAGRWWRLLLVMPFYGAGVGFFQAKEETWVALAARGARNMDEGEEKIEEPGILKQVRGQAKIVHLYSILFAVGLTVLVLLLP